MSDMSPPAGWPFPALAADAAPCDAAGGAPVCRLCDLDPVAAAAVLYLRRYRRGGPGQVSAMRADIAETWPGAAAAADHLADVFFLIREHGLRPMGNRRLAAPSVGLDEACLARLVSTAATGEAEDALRLALMLVRADLAPAAVASARQAGLTLHRAMLRCRSGTGAVLH